MYHKSKFGQQPRWLLRWWFNRLVTETITTRARVHPGWYTACCLGLYSLSGKTSYRKISWCLEVARFGFNIFQSLWNLAGTSAALLPRCLSNFRAIRPLQHPISRLRDFTRFGVKTSYRLVNRGPEVVRAEGTIKELLCGGKMSETLHVGSLTWRLFLFEAVFIDIKHYTTTSSPFHFTLAK